MDLQAVTSQLYIVAGLRQDRSDVPGLVPHAAPPPAARGRTHDRLIVHLTIGDDPAETETLAQDLLDAITRRYFATTGSVTAALRDAILEANQLLLRLNMTGSGPSYDGAVSCAVLRGQELYLVQGGESLALIGRNFGVERPPARRERMTPLGRSANLDLRYLHNWLEPGDMLLLADAGLADVSSEQMRPVLVDSTVEDSLPLLVEIVGNRSARILLVEFTSETAIDLPVTARPAGPAPTVPTPPSPESAPTILSQPPSAEEPARRGVSIPDLELPSAAELQTTARRAGAQTARGLATATGWTADVMHRLRPGSPPQAEEKAAGWAVPLLAAVIIPIVIAVVVGSVYIQRGRVTRFSELRRDMQAALIAASESPPRRSGANTVRRCALPPRPRRCAPATKKSSGCAPRRWMPRPARRCHAAARHSTLPLRRRDRSARRRPPPRAERRPLHARRGYRQRLRPRDGGGLRHPGRRSARAHHHQRAGSRHAHCRHAHRHAAWRRPAFR